MHISQPDDRRESNQSSRRRLLVGAGALLYSAVCLLTSVGSVIAMVGIRSDMLISFALHSGRSSFDIVIAAGIVGVVACAVAMTTLFVHFRRIEQGTALTVLVVGIAAVSIEIAVLGLQYGLGTLAPSTAPLGQATLDFMVSARTVAGVGGWIGDGMLALAVLLVSVGLRGSKSHLRISDLGLVTAALVGVVALLNANYAYLLIFGIWELGVGLALAASTGGVAFSLEAAVAGAGAENTRSGKATSL